WEHENAYTDSLGTLQTDRNFATGRASGGVKVSYPLAWSSATNVAPYLGLYGDFATGSAMSLSESVIATKHPTLVQVWIACRSGARLGPLTKPGRVELGPGASATSVAPLFPPAAGRAATEPSNCRASRWKICGTARQSSVLPSPVHSTRHAAGGFS